MGVDADDDDDESIVSPLRVGDTIINNIFLCGLCMEFNAIKMTSNTKYM